METKSIIIKIAAIFSKMVSLAKHEKSLPFLVEIVIPSKVYCCLEKTSSVINFFCITAKSFLKIASLANLGPLTRDMFCAFNG